MFVLGHLSFVQESFVLCYLFVHTNKIGKVGSADD